MLRVFKYFAPALLAVLFVAGAIEFLGRPMVPMLLASPARSERPCTPTADSTAIIIVHGQSNAGNYGAGRYSATEAVENFDPESGKCFSAVDPLLGADGNGANFATRLGDILIQSGKFERVLIASIAVGGASLAELNSIHLNKIDNLIIALKRADLTPTHFLFQQGETDASSKTTETEYLASFNALVRKFRSAGYQAPFYIAQSTKCDAVNPKNTLAIRRAQAAAVNTDLNIRRGPDIDIIGNEGRSRGNCHMNEMGTLANAALWAAFIGRP